MQPTTVMTDRHPRGPLVLLCGKLPCLAACWSFLPLWFPLLQNVTYMETCTFVASNLCAWPLAFSRTLLRFIQVDVSVSYSFLLINSILSSGCTTLHSLVEDIWVTSSFCLLCIQLQWTFTYKSLCEHIVLVFLDEYL